MSDPFDETRDQRLSCNWPPIDPQQVASNEEPTIDGMPREQWLAKWLETCNEKIVDGMTAEKWLAIRKEAGREIDPETAEVHCIKTAHIDPYGIYPELREYEGGIGKVYFARSPESDVWVVFSDLPRATAAALSEKLRMRGRAELEALGLLPPSDDVPS
jgi:hypothetical protein